MSLTGLAFMLMFCLGLVAALSVRPIYGLYTYVATFYLHPPSRWWGDGLPDIRWSLVAASITLLALYLNAEKRRSRIDSGAWYASTIGKGLFIYVVWMWLQLPWVESPYHLDGTILYTKFALLFFLIIKIVDNEQDLAGFCLAHVIGCAFLGWLVYQSPDTGRLESVGGPGIDNANTLGMHLSTGLFFSAFLLLIIKDWRKWILFAAIPLIVNAIFQTQTRGAIVGILIGGVLTVYLKPKKTRKTYYALAALGLIGVLFMANDAFLARMETIKVGVEDQSDWDNSALSRIAIAKAQLHMFADHPLGVGHQGTATLSRQYLDARWMASQTGDRASHNTVLSVLVDQGIPGIVIITVMFISILRSLRNLKILDKGNLPNSLGQYRTMLGGTLAVILGAGMFAQYIKAEIQIWVFALFVVLLQLAKSYRRVEDHTSTRYGAGQFPARTVLAVRKNTFD